MSRLSVAVLVLLLAAPVRATGPDKLVAPVANRPPSFRIFGGPIGTSFEARMTTDLREPRELRLDSSFKVTITIRYTDPSGELPQVAPRPPMLGERLGSDFTIGPVVEKAERLTWRYTIELTPLSEKVDRIPALLFAYYSPQGYRVLELPGINIKVLPREDVRAAELDNRAELPAAASPAYHFALGQNLLRHEDRWDLPSLPTLALIFVVPPLACLAWYRLWRQLYPDEALRLRRKRSRAAKAALRGLDLARVARADVRPTLAASIVTTYLKERLDLPVHEPTPRETAEHLEQVGCSKTGVRRAAEFFELCDSTRFGADPISGREHLIGLGVDLIQTLEKEAA
jgi:hypothetical protein